MGLQKRVLALMRTQEKIEDRKQFFTGFAIGLVLVIIKLIFYLPIDIADDVYGGALLLTLLVTAGQILGTNKVELQGRWLDFLFGLLFPLDLYAVLVLFGVPLTK